jgi:hypothetical protein
MKFFIFRKTLGNSGHMVASQQGLISMELISYYLIELQIGFYPVAVVLQ